MLDKAWARRFAEEWVDAWNSHDLDRILAHYADDFEMTSPFIVERMNEPSGKLSGKAEVAAYWQKGLSATPPLQFELVDVLTGVDSITLYYRHVTGKRNVAEVLTFNQDLQVVNGSSHHGTVG